MGALCVVQLYYTFGCCATRMTAKSPPNPGARGASTRSMSDMSVGHFRVSYPPSLCHRTEIGVVDQSLSVIHADQNDEKFHSRIEVFGERPKPR